MGQTNHIRQDSRMIGAAGRPYTRDLTNPPPMADNVPMAKILVVEDNASMREILTSIIAKKGFETENAASVGDALALLKESIGARSFIITFSIGYLAPVSGMRGLNSLVKYWPFSTLRRTKLIRE
jgi:PleD family two-component response regulator